MLIINVQIVRSVGARRILKRVREPHFSTWKSKKKIKFSSLDQRASRAPYLTGTRTFRWHTLCRWQTVHRQRLSCQALDRTVFRKNTRFFGRTLTHECKQKGGLRFDPISRVSGQRGWTKTKQNHIDMLWWCSYAFLDYWQVNMAQPVHGLLCPYAPLRGF